VKDIKVGSRVFAYKIKFNPVFQDRDAAFLVDEDMPKELFQPLYIRSIIIERAGEFNFP
jgi:hypothetical protein